MTFQADSVETWSEGGVETVFLGNAEEELALSISGMPATGGHTIEWNDQSDVVAHAIKQARLSGPNLRVDLLPEAAALLGHSAFDIVLVCDDGLLAEVSQRLSHILGRKFALAAPAAKTSARTASAPKPDYGKIKYLNLEGKDLDRLPAYVQEMTALETAKLARNPRLDLDAVCQTLARCPALRELSFTTDRPVPESIGRLTRLESLSLDGFTTPQALPESLGRLRRLKYFLFMTDSEAALPESFADLTDLEQLHMRTRGWRLPSRFHRLSKLKTLDFSQCRMDRAPEEMAGMTAVETVILDSHGDRDFAQILTVVARMPSLRTLELNTNPAPKETGLCRQITELNIWTGFGDETPQRLPDEIFALTRLETLILSANRFDEVPAAIGNLAGLRSLVFIESDFERLPDSIGRLSNLRYLNVSENPSFHELPDSLGRLTRLEQLYLQDNPRLTRLPKSVVNLKSLTEVCLSNADRVSNVPARWSSLMI